MALVARVAPYQFTRSPGSLWANALSGALMLIAIGLIPKTALSLPAFTERERFVYRCFVLLMTAWWIGFVIGRDWWLRAADRKQLGHAVWVPLAFMTSGMAELLLFIGVNMIVMRVVSQDELTRTEPSATLRVAVLGGSTTRGFPFPDEWQGSYPFLMQHLLRDERHLPAAVWNLGVDSVGLDFILDLLQTKTRAIRPTTVVINSVVNNAFGSPATFRERLTTVVTAAKQVAAHVVLVKEPALEPIYAAGRWSTVAPFIPSWTRSPGRSARPWSIRCRSWPRTATSFYSWTTCTPRRMVTSCWPD